MKLWMSTEFSGGIEEQVRLASNYVEDEINSHIENINYGIDLDGWDCIAILMEGEDSFEEVIKYSKKKREMDFRLVINFDQFVSTDAIGQQKLFYQMLKRSLDLLIGKGVNETGVNALRADVESVAKTNDWQ